MFEDRAGDEVSIWIVVVRVRRRRGFLTAGVELVPEWTAVRVAAGAGAVCACKKPVESRVARQMERRMGRRIMTSLED